MNKERINNAIKNTNIVKDMFIKMCDNYIDSQRKIDRAIDYIELSTKMQKVLEKEPLNELQVKKILDILRGKDDE